MPTPEDELVKCLDKIKNLSQIDCRLIVKDVLESRLHISDSFRSEDGSIQSCEVGTNEYVFLDSIKSSIEDLNNVVTNSVVNPQATTLIFDKISKAFLQYINNVASNEEITELENALKDSLGNGSRFFAYIQNRSIDNPKECANIMLECCGVMFSALKSGNLDIARNFVYSIPREDEELQCLRGTHNRFFNLNVKVNCGAREGFSDYYAIYEKLILHEFTDKYKEQINEGSHVHIPQYLIFLLGAARDGEVDMEIASMLYIKDQVIFCENFTNLFKEELEEYIENKVVRNLLKEVQSLKIEYPGIFSGDDEVDYEEGFGQELQKLSCKYTFDLAPLVRYDNNKSILNSDILDEIVESKKDENEFNKEALEFYNQIITTRLENSHTSADLSIDYNNLFADSNTTSVIKALREDNLDNFLVAADFLTALYFTRAREGANVVFVVNDIIRSMVVSTGKNSDAANLEDFDTFCLILREKSENIDLNLSSKILQFEQGFKHLRKKYYSSLLNICKAAGLEESVNRDNFFTNALFGASDSDLEIFDNKSDAEVFKETTNFIRLDNFLADDRNFSGVNDGRFKEVRTIARIRGFYSNLASRRSEIIQISYFKLVEGFNTQDSQDDVVGYFVGTQIHSLALRARYNLCNFIFDSYETTGYNKAHILQIIAQGSIVNNNYKYVRWVISKLDHPSEIGHILSQKYNDTTLGNAAFYYNKPQSFKALLDENYPIDWILNCNRYMPDNSIRKIKYSGVYDIISKKEYIEVIKTFLEYKLEKRQGMHLSKFTDVQGNSVLIYLQDVNILDYIVKCGLPAGKINRYHHNQPSTLVIEAADCGEYNVITKITKLFQNEIIKTAQNTFDDEYISTQNALDSIVTLVNHDSTLDEEFLAAKRLLLRLCQYESVSNIDYFEASHLIMRRGDERVNNYICKLLRLSTISHSYNSWVNMDYSSEEDLEKNHEINEAILSIISLATIDDQYIKIFKTILEICSGERILDIMFDDSREDGTLIEKILTENARTKRYGIFSDNTTTLGDKTIILRAIIRPDAFNQYGNYAHNLVDKFGINFYQLKLLLDQTTKMIDGSDINAYLHDCHYRAGDHQLSPFNLLINNIYSQDKKERERPESRDFTIRKQLADDKNFDAFMDSLNYFKNAGALFYNGSEFEHENKKILVSIITFVEMRHISVVSVEGINSTQLDRKKKATHDKIYSCLYDGLIKFSSISDILLEEFNFFSENEAGQQVKNILLAEHTDSKVDMPVDQSWRINSFLPIYYNNRLNAYLDLANRSITKASEDGTLTNEYLDKCFNNIKDIIEENKDILISLSGKGKFNINIFMLQNIYLADDVNSDIMDEKKSALCKSIANSLKYDLFAPIPEVGNVGDEVYRRCGRLPLLENGKFLQERNGSALRVTEKLYNRETSITDGAKIDVSSSDKNVEEVDDQLEIDPEIVEVSANNEPSRVKRERTNKEMVPENTISSTEPGSQLEENELKKLRK